MGTDQQHKPVGWGHRLREENRGLREKIDRLRKELGYVQRELQSTWKVVEDIPGGVILIQQQKLLFANETACRELGYTREEMLSMDASDLFGPDVMSFAASLHQGKTGNQPASTQYEASLATKSGQTLSAELRAHKMLYKGKTAFLFHIINLDERKAQENQRMQSTKAEASTRLLSGFGRELEAFKTLLEENTSRIQRPDSHGENRQPSLKTIEMLREKEARLSLDLDCLTRGEYNPSEMALLDLKSIIKTAIEISRPEMTAGQNVNTSLATIKTFMRAASQIYGCKKELQNVFAGIILNAREALPDGGDIYLTAEEHSGLAHIYVQDNGPGMPEEIIDNIFDPFFTTKDGAHRGLGLSLSHAIIARHQGEISVTSEEGRGSTFVVKLPLAKDASLVKTTAAKKGVKDSRILIIGDEGILTHALYSVLLSKDCNITMVSTYLEGLKALRNSRFDLIIADRDTSPADTFRIIHRIKSLRPDLPVALINAGTTPRETGADLTMGRPLDIDRFLSLVSTLLAEGVASK